MTLSRTSAVWATLAVALALSAVHLFAPRIRRRLPLTSQAVTSFGGGVAAAYVFLYLLPRLAEGNQAVAAVLGDKVRSTPLAGLATSLVALLGFVTFYALERVTHRSQRGTAEPTRAVFLVQLAFFAAYSGLMTYTLATKWQAGALAALLFAIAMGLHIFATDHVLAEHFPVRLTGRWRFVLAGGALTGWVVAVAVRAHRNSADQHVDRVSRWRDPAERLHRRAAAGAAFQLWLVRGGSGRLCASADLRNGRR